MGKERRLKFVDARTWDEVHLMKMEERGNAQTENSPDTNFHFLSPVPGHIVPELRKTQRKR